MKNGNRGRVHEANRYIGWLQLLQRAKPLLVLGLVSLSNMSFAAAKVSPDLATLANTIQAGQTLDVILQFTNPPSTGELAWIASAGGRVNKIFHNIRGAFVT